jgi:hypothetical protein
MKYLSASIRGIISQGKVSGFLFNLIHKENLFYKLS